jgi:UPF0755 protein
LSNTLRYYDPGRRDQVAIVFHRRLRSGIPFGSCPSVEYVLGSHRPFLTSDDVSIHSPYNLYKKPGLTPTPICFFSDSALQDALRRVHENLYYEE